MFYKRAVIIFFAAIVLSFAFANADSTTAPVTRAENKIMNVYVGTYTKTSSKGIYLYELDTDSGAFTSRGLAVAASDPEFLAFHPNHHFLYTGVSTPHGGSIAAFRIEPGTGMLTLVNQQPIGKGGATHISVDPTGQSLLVADYSAAMVGLLPIESDGRLSPPTAVIHHTGSSVDPQRQRRAYPHSINIDPSNKYALAPDLGTDKIVIYRFDAAAHLLTANDPPFVTVPPGSGPRHMAFHPNKKFAYLINEMGNTVIGYRYDGGRGALTQLQIVPTLPADFKRTDTAAEVAVHPNGQFLYASNRGQDAIAIFAVDASTGLLTSKGWQSTLGKGPRFFGIDPTGRWLLAANQDSDSIVVFRIDASSGQLTQTGTPTKVGMPVSLVFLQH